MADITAVKNRFGIVGNSPALTAAIDRAVKVAPIDLSVLVYGESGSGKEFFPQIIHAYGARKHKKYIAVNCGAIPEGTIDSELFGHEKGAFTGAVSSRKGYFEEADGGTIFLDEVAELPLTTQARLLRVLETGEYLKVGSSQVQTTDIRVVAATNVDLLEAVREGRFREDLYYRLSTVVINVPPLRDRGDDILLLARKFAADFSEKYMTSPITFSEESRRALLIYPWPGNVRQLKNIIEQLSLFNAGEEISRHTVLDLLPLGERSERVELNVGGGNVPAKAMLGMPESPWPYIAALRGEIDALKGRLDTLEGHHDAKRPENPLRYLPYTEAKDEVNEEEPGEENSYPSLEAAERDTIVAALRMHNGDKKAAAQQLSISTRTLYRKIHDLGIEEF
ncbi:MAG: sigma-54 dependent transcriptional regulator [Muribaculaceae bacterium]|nr:sigma-54 dependent transcriptional regulator [Muribaculaceae bacterium]